MYYFDTSALIKKYLEEEGTEKVLDILKTDNFFFTSSLTYAEIYATFNRLYRDHSISLKEKNFFIDEFENDWSLLGIIEFKSDVRQFVSKICNKVGLKGADTVHLASALALAKREIPTVFVCTDKKLNNAASEFNLELFDLSS